MMIEACEKPKGPVPAVCVLDRDGELTSALKEKGAKKSSTWPCGLSELYCYKHVGQELGFVPCTFGAPFAVYVAEQLFACGCKHVIHLTNGGKIKEQSGPSFYVLVEKALRDEGTSLHYEPPSKWSSAPDKVLRKLPTLIFNSLKFQVRRGYSWTIDAPFRQTQDARKLAEDKDILCVEMEASALMSYAKTRDKSIVSFVKVENSEEMPGITDDLDLLLATSKAFFS